MLGEAQREMGQLDDAAVSLQEAVRLLPAAAADPAYQGPNRGDLMMILGQVRMLQRLWLEAAKAFEEAPGLRGAPGRKRCSRRPSATTTSAATRCVRKHRPAVPSLPGIAAIVREWKRKIEDATFVATTAPTSAPSIP